MYTRKESGLLVPDMSICLPMRFGNGKFRSQVVRNGKDEILDTGFNPQVITNSMWENWLGAGSNTSRAAIFNYAAVGTDTAEATVADTTLTQVGSRAVAQSVESSSSVSGTTFNQRIQYRFAQGAITVPVTSAAIFGHSTGGSCNVKSRLKDAGGNPTSIPLTSLDALYLTWEVDSFVNTTDFVTTQVYGGVNYNVVVRPASWNTGGGTNPLSQTNPFCAYTNAGGFDLGLNSAHALSSQTLTSVTTNPSLSSASPASSFSHVAYAAGSKSKTITYTWSAANSSANALGGIGSVLIHNGSGTGYQVSFSAVSGGGKIPKNDTNQFVFSMTFQYGI